MFLWPSSSGSHRVPSLLFLGETFSPLSTATSSGRPIADSHSTPLVHYPTSQTNLTPEQPSIRARVWKLLLHVDHLDSSDYLRLVDKGPSSVSTKSQSPSPPTMCTSSYSTPKGNPPI